MSWRRRQAARVRLWLERRRHPRLALGLIAVLTGVSALATSVLMLHAGVEVMWVRYPVAVGVAWLVCVGLLWAWLRREHRDGDVPDVSGSGPSPDGELPGGYSGGGGRFGGGGASSDYAPAAAESDAGAASEIAGGAVELVGGAVGEGCGVVVVFGLVLAAVAVVGWWLLSFAPVLATELVIDTFLAAVLYRRLRRDDGPYLLHAIVRRTARPFAWVAFFGVAVGLWAAIQVPGARTLGEVWSHFQSSR